MANVTYFVALPFLLNGEGELVPGEAQDRQTASTAIRATEDMTRRFLRAFRKRDGQARNAGSY